MYRRSKQLVKRYDRNIFRIAQHITQNREDAEDVVQDAFLKAYENLEQFQGNSKFYTWLVRIAVNESLMKLRRRRSDRTVSLDEDIETEEDTMPREVADWSPNPEQLYKQGELKDILRKTIQGLPASFRTVFVLRDVEGLSTEETAEALDLSIPAVKSRLLRARLQLRERLNKYFRKPKGGDGKQVTCTDFLKELTDYLDATIDASTHAELEDHLAWCHNCYVICNTTKKTIEIYRDSQLYELPEDLRTRLEVAILSKCTTKKKRLHHVGVSKRHRRLPIAPVARKILSATPHAPFMGLDGSRFNELRSFHLCKT